MSIDPNRYVAPSRHFFAPIQDWLTGSEIAIRDLPPAPANRSRPQDGPIRLPGCGRLPQSGRFKRQSLVTPRYEPPAAIDLLKDWDNSTDLLQNLPETSAFVWR